jgi:hypothetical protein
VKQRKRGRVRVVGVVQRRDTGRPELVYGFATRDHEHCIRVTDLELILGVPITDGRAGDTEPDGLAQIGGRLVAVEVDNSGHMDRKQMRRKWHRYQNFAGFILVVTLTSGRMERLRKDAELVKDKALFTTFALLEGPARRCVDFYGNSVSLF